MVSSGWLAFIWKAFAAAGRLALTNYLVQTLICTFFFYGYGMGYYGRFTQVQLYYFVAEVLIAQVVFSVLWLRHYQYGPVEWLWRCLSSGKRISNRLRQPVNITGKVDGSVYPSLFKNDPAKGEADTVSQQ